jgi:hypothetical protein
MVLPGMPHSTERKEQGEEVSKPSMVFRYAPCAMLYAYFKAGACRAEA